MQRLLVLTSGGDAPGMNAAIRAVVRTACFHGMEVFGSRRGYFGLVYREVSPLRPEDVANTIQRGGTLLKTGRCDEFMRSEVRARCAAYLRELGIEGIVVIGGDGSFRGAAQLASEGGPRCIGIPGTIDNDIAGTEYTIGFDTARNTALDAIDKIRDTASSHDRNFLIEVMGRRTGFLALDVGIAGGAELVLVPEFEPSIDEVAQRVMRPRREKLSHIIVVAEGDQPGRSLHIASELKLRTSTEYRVCILGHTQRGGTPTALDRKMASMMGALAVNELRAGRSRLMTVYVAGQVRTAPFPEVHAMRRQMTEHDLLGLNEILAT